MYSRIAVAVMMCASASLGLVAQETAAGPAFDAASVLRNTSGSNSVQGSGARANRGTVEMVNERLRQIVVTAFMIRDFQLIAPDWLTQESYDIHAKASAPVPQARFNEMFQRLLKERFGLRYHEEERNLPSYKIVIAKGGPKLRSSDAGTESGRRYAKNHITLSHCTTGDLAQVLGYGEFLGLPVSDTTGLAGAYDIDLHWDFDSHDAAAQNVEGVSIFTALQDQLGLKIESTKSPQHVIVIDAMNRDPTAN
jgi:uncharacterized protein (TIGR03435 family)